MIMEDGEGKLKNKISAGGHFCRQIGIQLSISFPSPLWLPPPLRDSNFLSFLFFPSSSTLTTNSFHPHDLASFLFCAFSSDHSPLLAKYSRTLRPQIAFREGQLSLRLKRLSQHPRLST